MPSYKGHLIGGVASFALIHLLLMSLNFAAKTQTEVFFCLGITLLGSLFPDIDTFSVIQKILLWAILFAAVLVFVYQAWWVLIIIAAIMLWLFFVTHRTTTHTKKFIFLIPLPAVIYISLMYPFYVNEAFRAYAFFVGGGISHIILDFNIKKK